MSPQESEGGGCLVWDDAVAEETEKLDSVKPARSQCHPINHATNAGLRESRGEPGCDVEDSAPAFDVSGARGPWWQAAHACFASGRAFLSAVSSECSPLFQSRAVAVAHSASTGHFGKRTAASVAVGHRARVTCGASESSEGRTGPTRPAAPPRLVPERCAVTVGQKEDAGALVGATHVRRTKADVGASPAPGFEPIEGEGKS